VKSSEGTPKKGKTKNQGVKDGADRGEMVLRPTQQLKHQQQQNGERERYI